MSKYEYGRISKSKKWYVRLKEWKCIRDNKGDLNPYCRILRIFRTPYECIKYIDWLKDHEKQNSIK